MARSRWIPSTVTPRQYRLLRITVAGLLVLGFLHMLQHAAPSQPIAVGPNPSIEPFKPMALPGFVNSGQLDKFECDELALGGVLEIQQSFYLEDDIYEIAESLKDHPMIDYDEQEKGISTQELIRRTWLRLAQSSVWIQKLKIHLTVTRIEFYTQGVKHWPRISFLRGQIYDGDWNELRNHTVHWHGEDITFPRIFDIPIPYKMGDGFFGPEDPRVVIEEGVDDAEPVIVFNMISDLKERTRAMHIYRPFTGASTILTIEEDQFVRPSTEKNWAPFFYNDHRHASTDHKRYPSHLLHFIYDFRPFRILRCHLFNGWCKRIYDVVLSDNARHGDHPGRISGGTNFVPLTLDPSAAATYIGFPRTHMGAGCQEGAIYRPELMVLSAREDHFHIDYLSGPIDFMDAVLWQSARADPCGEGHILIANSIARWDREADIMAMSLTVDDSTTQMVRISGVREHVELMPIWGGQRDNESWSTIGQDVVGCSVQSAQVYAEAAAAPLNGTDLRKQQEDEEKKQREEAEEGRKKQQEAEEAEEKKQREEVEERKKKQQEAEEAERKKHAEEKKHAGEAERLKSLQATNIGGDGEEKEEFERAEDHSPFSTRSI